MGLGFFVHVLYSVCTNQIWQETSHMYPISASAPLAYSIKTLRESSKIFVEQALHVARIQFQTQA